MYSVTVEKNGERMRLKDSIQKDAFINAGWTEVKDAPVQNVVSEQKPETEKAVADNKAVNPVKRGRKRYN